MHLKEFYIDNFRGYRNFKIEAKSNRNILTGVNNSGKTTILEAISLWNEIFNNLICVAQKSNNSIGLRNGDYRFGKNGQNYLDYRRINSVRSFNYQDIFYNLDTSLKVKLSALIELNPTDKLEIGFILHKANGNNYNVYLDNHNNFDFRKFNDSFNSLPDCINCYFSSPVATIPSYEEFATTPKIKEAIKIRQSVLFFRNRLFNLSKSDNFDDFKNTLSLILYNELNQIDFNIYGDKSKDINISIDVNIKNNGYKNISLLGSGTIQIIEILLHLFESKKELNIILLDEPDSHIHRDIQKRLLKFLNTNESQIFLTTHNESLIRSANPNNIFFIDETVSDSNQTIIKPVGQDVLPQRKIGIANSHHSKIINQIGSETSLDILNALEADKILFVEGTDDSEYIQKLIELNQTDKNCVFWSFGGLDNLITKIKHYEEFFKSLGCNQSIWNKCSIIIDADFLTDAQKLNLKDELNRKLKIPIFIWSSYTIESSILTDISKLEQIFSEICLNQQVSKTSLEIVTQINHSIETLKNEKLDLLNKNVNYGRRITGQLETRVNNLTNNLEISRKRVFGTTTTPNLFNEYRIFCSNQLNLNRVSHISEKDDVELFLERIYVGLNLNKDPLFINYFSSLLNSVNSLTINQEWRDLITFVNN